MLKIGWGPTRDNIGYTFAVLVTAWMNSKQSVVHYKNKHTTAFLSVKLSMNRHYQKNKNHTVLVVISLQTIHMTSQCWKRTKLKVLVAKDTPEFNELPINFGFWGDRTQAFLEKEKK